MGQLNQNHTLKEGSEGGLMSALMDFAISLYGNVYSGESKINLIGIHTEYIPEVEDKNSKKLCHEYKNFKRTQIYFHYLNIKIAFLSTI